MLATLAKENSWSSSKSDIAGDSVNKSVLHGTPILVTACMPQGGGRLEALQLRGQLVVGQGSVTDSEQSLIPMTLVQSFGFLITRNRRARQVQSG